MSSSPSKRNLTSASELHEPQTGVLTEAMVIQFLRSKLVERDRSIFELQKRLEESDAALHQQRLQTTELRAALRRSEMTLRPTGVSNHDAVTTGKDRRPCEGEATDPHCRLHTDEPLSCGWLPHSCSLTLSKWRAWKHTSKVIVEALMERLALESEASEGKSNIQEWARRDALRLLALHKASAAPLHDPATSKSRSAMFDALRDLETQNAKLSEQLVQSEGEVASSTVQCKRLQTESAELRLRNDILTHRVEQLQQVSAASMRTGAELTAVRRELEEQRQSLDRALAELGALQRVHGELQDEYAQHKNTAARRYDELLRARDGLSRELNAVRLELAASMEHRGGPPGYHNNAVGSGAGNMGALSPPRVITSGPLRLSRASSGATVGSRNPYLSGMLSPLSHR